MAIVVVYCLFIPNNICYFFFFQAEDGIRDRDVTGVQTCALPIFAMEGLAVPFTGVAAFRFNFSAGPLAGATVPSALTRGNVNTRYVVDPGLGLTGAELEAN